MTSKMILTDTFRQWLTTSGQLFDHGVDEGAVKQAITGKASALELHVTRFGYFCSGDTLTVHCEVLDPDGAVRAMTVSRRLPPLR